MERNFVFMKSDTIKFIFVFLLSIFFCFNSGYAAENEDNAIIPKEVIEQESQDQQKMLAVKKIAKERKEEKEKNKSIKNFSKESLKSPVNEYGLKMIQALGIIIGGLLVILFFVKRLNSCKKVSLYSGKIEILERKNLTPRSQIVLAKVEDQKVLIGINQDNISMLLLEQKNNFEDILKQKENEC